MSRKPLGPKARYAILKRDGFACQYCGAKPPNVLLQVDHIVSVVEGGSNEPENLKTSCEACNAGKGRHSLYSCRAVFEALDRDDEPAAHTALVAAICDRFGRSSESLLDGFLPWIPIKRALIAFHQCQGLNELLIELGRQLGHFEVERHGWLPADVAARRAEYESVDIAKVREATFLPHREVH